jgi:hypothetical protein
MQWLLLLDGQLSTTSCCCCFALLVVIPLCPDFSAPCGIMRPSNCSQIREHKDTGIYVEGLSEHFVTSPAAVYDKIRRGSENRATASTNMNRDSSRSHSVFILCVKPFPPPLHALLPLRLLCCCSCLCLLYVTKEGVWV